MIRTFKVGDPFPDLLHQGTFLPIGARVQHGDNGRYNFEQLAPRVWRNGQGDYLHPHYSHTPVSLDFLPDGQEEVQLPGESQGAYLWRIRDAALSAAERSGVNFEPVKELVQRLGAEQPRFELGHLVSSYRDAIELPHGSLLYTGDPSYPKHFTVYKVRDRRLDKVFGADDRISGEPLTLYSAPGNLPSPPEEPEAAEIDLAKIALRAWRLGKVYKRSNGWCGVFETTLEALGINDKSIAATGETTKVVGDPIQRSDAALLPQGSLLAWMSTRNRDAWAIYRRDDGHTRNRSNTVRMAGHGDSGMNSQPTMTIIQLPGEDMRWQVSGTLLRTMPEGTRYRRNVSGRMGEDEHTLRLAALPDFYYHYWITSIPGVDR